MRKSKGFTLIELLVVISVIALLLAVLMPVLGRARELGQRAVCANNLKTLMLANELYASKCDGYYASPLAYDPALGGQGLDSNNTWMGNDTFRECMAMSAYIERGIDRGAFDLPNKLLCPTDKKSDKEECRFYYPGTTEGTLTSYGYNYTDWDSSSWTPPVQPPAYSGKKPGTILAGWRNDSVRTPAEKLAFTDSVDWWIAWPGANYEIGWDILGQACVGDYKDIGDDDLGPANVHGPTIYRHNEGVNIAFYDGHVGYMKKQEVFIRADFDAHKHSMWWVKRCPPYNPAPPPPP